MNECLGYVFHILSSTKILLVPFLIAVIREGILSGHVYVFILKQKVEFYHIIKDSERISIKYTFFRLLGGIELSSAEFLNRIYNVLLLYLGWALRLHS